MTGIGSQKNKIFGFTSCERPVGSSEGMNLIIEEPTKEGFNYCLTNIEYTDFKQRGIHDLPTSKESHFSQFPSNTNILFVDISTVRETIKQHPLPGRLINLKHRVPYIDKDGVRSTVLGGRIESTMQNIADYFVDHFDRPLSENELGSYLKTFLVFNSRLKTLSSTKKSFHPNEKPADTPEQSYFDLLLNTRNLLSRCQFTLPVQQSFKDYLEYGPNFIFLYHPALGPLYSIISQKIRGGVFYENSEMQLNIPEVDFENIHIDGSLLIDSNQPLGVLDDQGLLEYANGTNCVLKNVSIRNQGINRSVNRCFWKNQLIRDECFKLFLEEGAEFIAENVSFEGHHEFIVPAYHRMQISQQSDGSLDIDLKLIMTPSWYWKYYFNDGDKIILEKENNN
jgi:UTP---glucose-1-phosphate uridylyltransferase